MAFEALTRKQSELLGELVKEWQAGAKDVLGKTSSAERINQVASHVQHAFVNAVAVMRDMAEIAAKSSQDVVTILNKRYHDGLAELRGVIGVKQDSA